MKTHLTRFSVALTLALLMSSLSVLAQGKHPPAPKPPTENLGYVCSVLVYLGIDQAAYKVLGVCEGAGGGEFQD